MEREDVPMRCLVTGVAGFVGSHIADRLLADGHEVRGIDIFIDYYPRGIKERNLEELRAWNNFTFVEADLLHVYLPPLLEGIDWIFHQAAQAGVRASWGKDFSRYVECNILATQRLLEAVLQSGTDIQRLVYASSSSVYGDTCALPVTEATIPRPVSPYGVTKLAAEHLCSLYHHNFGLPTISLRYFTVYGPRQRPDMAFYRFCKAAIDHEPLHVYGDGHQTRDFTYISDVVEANIRAAITDGSNGAVMNIAGGSRVSVRHVIQLLQEISGSPLAVTFDEQQHGDVQHTFADTGLAEKLIHYKPLVALPEGLAREFAHIASLYTSMHSTIF
jgi:nucleoside-diphosphate-sugar epimerase